MSAFVITMFIIQIFKIGCKLTHLGKNQYPRNIEIKTPGVEFAGILIGLGFAIWAGVLIF